ncbi:AP-3 complex subunit beta, partial [Spiromyces aspiralis]
MQGTFSESMSKYLKSAVAFTQDAVERSWRISETLIENAKDLSLDTPGQFYDTAEGKLAQIPAELSSSNPKQKLLGLKRLIALISRGIDVSKYFPDVVKNVASPSVEIRKLVYIYLLRYAEKEQDLVLLSINAFQKDLSDPNQVIRGLSLRVLSGIRVPMIESIVMYAVDKCSIDPSPFVRKTAAYAVTKAYEMNPVGNGEELVRIIERMLNEDNPMVIGGVIQAFERVCPYRFDLIHPHYQRWCRMIIDIDEWGQIAIVNLLSRYARTQFLNPTDCEPLDVLRSSPRRAGSDESDFYSSCQEEKGPGSGSGSGSGNDPQLLDPDHILLLDSIEPLLRSRNSSVVMAVVAALYYLAPPSRYSRIAKPLIRLMKTNRETGYVVLGNIAEIAKRYPHIFAEHVRDFFIMASDPLYICKHKLKVLALVASTKNVGVLLPELLKYIKSPQGDLVGESVIAIAQCAIQIPEWRQRCFGMTLRLLQDTRESIVGKAVNTIALLLKLQHRQLVDMLAADSAEGSPQGKGSGDSVVYTTPRQLYATLCYLVRLLDAGKVPKDSQSSVYQLTALYSSGEGNATDMLGVHALDVLRIGARLFRDSDEAAKLSILELSTHLMRQRARSNSNVAEDSMHSWLHEYLFTLARYDTSYDLRDRARFLRSLFPLKGDEHHYSGLSDVASHKMELFSGLIPGLGSLASCDSLVDKAIEDKTLGTLSLTLRRHIPGYLRLPDWPKTKPGPVDRGSMVPLVKPRHASHFDAFSPSVGASRLNYFDQFGDNVEGQGQDEEEELDAFLNTSDSDVPPSQPHLQQARQHNLPQMPESYSDDSSEYQSSETSSLLSDGEGTARSLSSIGDHHTDASDNEAPQDTQYDYRQQQHQLRVED